MSFTLVNIIEVDNKWLVPPIMPKSNGYESADKWDALDWASAEAHEYEKKTGRIKIPVLSDNTVVKRYRVQLGDKAVKRLELDTREIHRLPVYNIRFIPMPPSLAQENGLSIGSSTNYGVYFGIVISRGKWASVCTSQVRKTEMTDNLSWSNHSVQRLKMQYNYPKNRYMPDDEPTPPIAPQSESPKRTADKFSAFYSPYNKMSITAEELGQAFSRITDSLSSMALSSAPRPEPIIDDAHRREMLYGQFIRPEPSVEDANPRRNESYQEWLNRRYPELTHQPPRLHASWDDPITFNPLPRIVAFDPGANSPTDIPDRYFGQHNWVSSGTISGHYTPPPIAEEDFPDNPVPETDGNVTAELDFNNDNPHSFMDGLIELLDGGDTDE
jgi:hypothetical protein